jgi:hypothetical protein
MFLIFLGLNLPKTIQAQKPCCFEVKESEIKLIHDKENNYHSILFNHFICHINNIQGLFSMVKDDPLDSQATRNLESNYSKYLTATVDKSINLTTTYQEEIALWDHQNFSNTTMAKITETFLPKFVTQLNQFNNTEAPIKYSKVKENYVKSFANEIKSYEFFYDFLKTNNSTANKLSLDCLSAALTYETIARKDYIEANNSSAVPPTNKENNINQQTLQQLLVTTNNKIERHVSIL